MANNSGVAFSLLFSILAPVASMQKAFSTHRRARERCKLKTNSPAPDALFYSKHIRSDKNTLFNP